MTGIFLLNRMRLTVPRFFFKSWPVLKNGMGIAQNSISLMPGQLVFKADITKKSRDLKILHESSLGGQTVL